MRTKSRLFSIGAALLMPLLAAAGPGYQVTSQAIMPADVPKVIAATDAFMASTLGKQYKGRLMLLQHVADGIDPSTHSFVQLFHSAAEAEAFAAAATNDPAWKTFLDTVVPVARAVSTSRTSTVGDWGDIADTDTVWGSYFFRVTDPAALQAAIEQWQQSPMGKKFPGQRHLALVSFAGVGGADAPTHVINVGYASMAEMEAFMEMSANDPDWLKYMATIDKNATRLGSVLFHQLKSWGPATLKSLTR